MPTNTDVARIYLAGVLAKLPENLRAQAEAAFNDANATAALDELGQGVKRQEDYSRAMDEARNSQQRATEAYNQNQAWYQANQAALQEAAQMRARGTADPDPNPGLNRPPTDPVDPKKYVPIEQFQQTVSESLGLFGVVIPKLMRRHERLFGEDLPTEELIAEAQRSGLSLENAYNARYATQLKAKADEAEAAKVKRIEDEAIARFRRENPQMPYPSPRAMTGSPLDGLKAGSPVEPASNLVAEAEQMYNELVSQKTGV